MAMTVVGLFDEASDAKAAFKDLVNAGFSRNDIKELESRDASHVQGKLKDHGVPDEDIRLYEAGVRHGDALLIAHTSDEQSETARQIMNRHDALDIHHAHQVRTTSTSRMSAPPVAATMATTATNNLSATDRTVNNGETVSVPVVEEQIAVGKRSIERGGARIHTRVVETPVTESVTLHEEHVTVDRHAVNRPANASDLNNAFQEVDVELHERNEVPVVAKEARVVEEVTIGKTASERTETISDTVRRTDVDVEEINEGDTSVLGNTQRVNR